LQNSDSSKVTSSKNTRVSKRLETSVNAVVIKSTTGEIRKADLATPFVRLRRKTSPRKSANLRRARSGIGQLERFAELLAAALEQGVVCLR